MRNIIKKINPNFAEIFLVAIIPLIPRLILLNNNFRLSFNYLDIISSYFYIFFTYILILFVTSKLNFVNHNLRIVFAAIIFSISFLYGAYEGLFLLIFNNFEIKFLQEYSDTVILISYSLLFYYLVKKILENIFKINLLITRIFFISIIFYNLILVSISMNNAVIKKDEMFNNNDFKLSRFDKKPNIYFIIFDMYSNEDYLNFLDKQDNLFNYLSSQSFIISKGLSNYSASIYSMPSIFNSNYFRDKIFLSNINKKNEKFYSQSTYRNSLIELLKYNKYKISTTYCTGEYYIKKKKCFFYKNLNYLNKIDISFNEAVFSYSIFKFLFPLGKKVINFLPLKNAKNIELNKFSDVIGIKNKEGDKPKFYYFHFSIPHPPYIFDKHCSFVNIPNSENTINNQLIYGYNNRKEGFLRNSQCTDKIIKEIVSKINIIDNKSIIFLLSDHGPHINHKKNNKKIIYEEILDQYGSLLAIRSQQYCDINNNMFYFNHVNLLRILSNCLSLNKNKILPFRLFYEDIHNRNVEKKILKKEDIEFILSNR